MIPHRSLSSDSSENAVSFRVEACRKRLRMIRASQKGSVETVEPVGMSVTGNAEVGTEMSMGQDVIEARAKRLDEVGIT